MSLLIRKRTLAIKVEGTAGTFDSPAGADATIRCYSDGDGPMLTPDIAFVPRTRQSGFGNSNSATGAKSAALAFYTHLHGKGSAGVPNWGTLLRAAGFALSSQTYTTSQTVSDFQTLSVAEYIDGRRDVARGMMLDLSFVLSAGAPGRLNVTGSGAYESDAADTALVTGTYEGVKPPTFDGAGSFSIGGTAYRVNEVTLNLGNQLVPIEDANATGGIAYVIVADRTPTLVVEPQAVLKASKNWTTDFTAGTERTIVMTLAGGTNNTITITANQCQLAGHPRNASRGGKLVEALTWEVNGSITVAFS